LNKISKEKFFLFSNIVYDIDLYLEKKAERLRGNRRRRGKNGDVDLAGPDSDQLVSKLIDQMKIATEEDRIFNKSRQPATAKLLLLPLIEQQLYRADLTEIFLDNGILTVFKVTYKTQNKTCFRKYFFHRIGLVHYRIKVYLILKFENHLLKFFNKYVERIRFDFVLRCILF
jgi:hypothetical protein